MELFYFYLIAIADNLSNFLTTFSFIFIGIFILTNIAFFIEDLSDEIIKVFNKFNKFTMIFAPILLLLSVLLPSSKALLLMLVVYQGLNIEGIEDLPANAVEALNYLLKTYKE